MWWILNSSLLAGACRGVPILVLAVCGCLFFFYTPLPTLVWDLQHSRLNNWRTKINPLTTALPGPRKRCSGIKILESRIQPQSPCLLVCLICNSATKDDSSCPLWSRALLTLREKHTDRDRERERLLFQTLCSEQCPEVHWVLSTAWQLLPVMKALLISVSGDGKSGCGHCMAIPSVQLTYIDLYLLPICPWHCAVTEVTVFSFLELPPNATCNPGSSQCYCALLRKTGGKVSASRHLPGRSLGPNITITNHIKRM